MSWMVGRAWLGAFAATVMVAGCSGGGSDGHAASSNPATLAEYVEEMDALVADAMNVTDLSGADLPTSGTASYDGVLTMEDSDGGNMVGDIDLSVDFGASSDPISGSVTNLVDLNDSRWGGSLDVNDSTLDRSVRSDSGSPTWTADLEGTITDPSATAYEVDGRMEGGFAGSDAGFVGGEVAGESCAAECVSFEGAFLADR